LVVLLLGSRRRCDQLPDPPEFELGELERRPAHFDAGNLSTQQRYLILDLLDGVLQIPTPAPGLCFDAPYRGLGRLEIRLRGIDGRLFHRDGISKRLLVKLNQKFSFFHTVVVIHQNPGNLTVNARRDERRVTIHEGIIRRNRAESEPDPRDAEPKRGCEGQSGHCSHHQFSPLYRLVGP
jgi:hypothetical protein